MERAAAQLSLEKWICADILSGRVINQGGKVRGVLTGWGGGVGR